MTLYGFVIAKGIQNSYVNQLTCGQKIFDALFSRTGSTYVWLRENPNCHNYAVFIPRLPDRVKSRDFHWARIFHNKSYMHSKTMGKQYFVSHISQTLLKYATVNTTVSKLIRSMLQSIEVQIRTKFTGEFETFYVSVLLSKFYLWFCPAHCENNAWRFCKQARAAKRKYLF
jgi:hypothetical protein